jgi:drug/metabolite transporter (DMT)-like permease
LLLSALSWAIAILCIRSHVWQSTPFQLIFWQTLLASLLLTPIALVFEGIPSVTLTPSLVALLAYTGIPGTALAYWAMTVINANLPATTTSLSILATPVVGILGSIVLLGESVDLPLAIAACMILGGIALGTLSPKRNG